MSVVIGGILGVLFGCGILISGMSNPLKVQNFFDVTGAWDPSLAFVMAGALAIVVIGYRVVLSRSSPIAGSSFHLPTASHIDAPLLMGSGLFGVGWGLSGFCPGGLVPVLAIGRPEPLIFFAGLALGMIGTKWWRSRPVA